MKKFWDLMNSYTTQRGYYSYESTEVLREKKALIDYMISLIADAERYRFLMRQMPCNIADLFEGALNFDEVDDEIDEEIRKEKARLDAQGRG